VLTYPIGNDLGQSRQAAWTLGFEAGLRVGFRVWPATEREITLFMIASFSPDHRVRSHRIPAGLLVSSLLVTFSAAGQSTTVVGWGWNNNGQATPPAGLTNIVAVSAGGGQSLALRADGTVVGWGFQPNVPPGLNGVAAITCCPRHSLALRSNGTVVAWGENPNGQTNVPAGLSNVIAVSGAGLHSLALKADGTVVGWGTNRYGQLDVPPGLSNVIAVAAGGDQLLGAWSLALKSDGTVVAWGDNRRGQTNVPAGLSNVVALGASPDFESLALRSDGTVVSWGLPARPVPAGLSNVVAIDTGDGNHLALRADGTLFAWGDNFEGAINVPASARNVWAMTIGYWHGLAVTRSTPPPWPRITTQPRSLRKLEGDTVTFSVTANAAAPLSYRWQQRGQNLIGQTNSTLVLSNTQFAQSGDYAVVVSAGGLSVRSAPAFLAISNRPVAFSRIAEGVEDTEVVITLEAFDPSNLLLAGTVVALPASGRLYQFDDGRRGAPIESVPAPFAGDTLLYVPAADGNGLPFDEFLFIVGNEIGDSLPANVTINIRPVNDPPGFIAGPDQEIDEDAGPQRVPGWATAIRAGPLNEDGQSLAFLVTNDAASLFSSPPVLDASGSLFYTPAPNANGSSTVTALLQDDGGSANDGQDRSAAQTFRITVRAVNDAPIAYPQAVSLDEDTVAPITLAASDVEGDALTYRVTTPTHGTLSGVASHLFYHPSLNYIGPDSFTFIANDGQVDSTAAVVSIQIAPINDAPAAGMELFSPARLTFTGSSNFVLLASNNSRGQVICDASPSTDIENDLLEFSWFRDSEAAPFALGVRVTNAFEVGLHTIVLRAFDGRAESESSLTLEILTPGEAVEALVTRLNEAPLERNRQRPLIASLKVAVASFDRGSFGAGANQLQAFQQKIRAQLATADPTLAETLSGAAGEILRAMASP
jgi:hypothetical protein